MFVGCGKKDPGQVDTTVPATTAAQIDSAADATETKTASADLLHSDKFKVADGAVSFTDMLDREVTIKQNHKKVIVLDYNSLDLWYHAGGTAVGRTEHILVQSRADEDDMGKEIREVEGLGGP